MNVSLFVLSNDFTVIFGLFLICFFVFSFLLGRERMPAIVGKTSQWN